MLLSLLTHTPLQKESCSPLGLREVGGRTDEGAGAKKRPVGRVDRAGHHRAVGRSTAMWGQRRGRGVDPRTTSSGQDAGG